MLADFGGGLKHWLLKTDRTTIVTRIHVILNNRTADTFEFASVSRSTFSQCNYSNIAKRAIGCFGDTYSAFRMIGQAMDQPLGVGKQASYGLGQIAGQIFRDVPSLLLLFFLTNVEGIEPVFAGIAIFFPKLLVGIGSDIVMGSLSSRLKAKFPMSRWLLTGAFLAPIPLILLFSVPDIAWQMKLIYVAFIFSLYMSIYSSFSVPYLALVASLTRTPEERTKLMAWRLAFTGLGLLIAAGAAPAFVAQRGGGGPAYIEMAVVLSIICSGSLLIAYLGTYKVANANTAQSSVESSSDMMEPHELNRLSAAAIYSAIKDQRFSKLFIANILQLTGGGMNYAAILYFITYNMQRADALSIIGIIMFAIVLGIILSQPVWVAIAKRVGKRKTYIAASALHITATMLWIGWPTAPFEIICIWAFLAGVGNSGWTMLGFSMVADLEAEEKNGIFSSLWVAADKVGFALGGTLLIGITLSAVGFDSTKAATGLPQSDMAIQGIMLAFGLFPSTLYLISVILMAGWKHRAEESA